MLQAVSAGVNEEIVEKEPVRETTGLGKRFDLGQRHIRQIFCNQIRFFFACILIQEVIFCLGGALLSGGNVFGRCDAQSIG